MRRAFETIELIDNDSNMIITLIKKIKVFVSVELDCNNLILSIVESEFITKQYKVSPSSPAELVGMLNSNGAIKKESLSPDNIYVWFVIVPVPLIT